GRFSRRSEVARIAVVSLIGLGINTLAMWVGISLGLRPMVAKMIAVPVVLIWNFMGRRLFVFEREKPPPVVTSLQAFFGGGEKFLSPLARRSRAALTRR
ncbi:MAG TPA: GtrA family protein, partial [Caulobacteraceae bacterium]